MLRQEPSIRDLSTQEYRKFVLPTTVAGLGVLLAFLLNLLSDSRISRNHEVVLVGFILAAAIYIAIYNFVLISFRRNKDFLIWLNAILSGGAFWFLTLILPENLILYYNLLVFLAVISVSIFSGRLPTLLMILVGTIPYIFYHINRLNTFEDWVGHFSVMFISLILNETTFRIQNISRVQVHHLEIINKFSRQVSTTLDRKKIIECLKTAIPNALASDTYSVSFVEGGEVHFLLLHDEGETFEDVRIPTEGTLTNWVVKNQKELFLPDLRQPIELEGVNIVIVGKQKTSLSWIGVPLTCSNLRGVLALASYQPNAFNRSDLELLSNLAQHAAQALENAAHHAEVEARARLDSMTGVFNHGYFLQILQRHANESSSNNHPLSLIMLDVDYFKQYNDTYGHRIGDQILTLLCDTIRSHIKNTDAVGRWGGEEFVISLPNASGTHAQAVAERIRETMRALKINGHDGQEIVPPTVSQGIALFPQESADIDRLIELADLRLYVAKNRGRDQIEPPPSHWTQFENR